MRHSDPCHTFDSDEPIQLIEEDCLGFTPYVCALYQLIKHNLPHDASFTIGIFGDWGTGKTSVMRMLQNLLARYPEEFVTLFFDAWAFEEFDNLFPPLIIELSKLAGEDKTIAKIASQVAEQVARVAIARATEGEVLFEDIKAGARKILGSEEASIRIYDYTDKLWELVIRITEGRKKLIIFIDDLDRIVPATKAIELLESMQLLMDFPNVVYVIGVNRNALLKALSVSYSYDPHDRNVGKNTPSWSEKYLEKFVQLPISLPVLQGSTLKNMERRHSYTPPRFYPHKKRSKQKTLKKFLHLFEWLFLPYWLILKYLPEIAYVISILLVSGHLFRPAIDWLLCTNMQGTGWCRLVIFILVTVATTLSLYPGYQILKLLLRRITPKKLYSDKVIKDWIKRSSEAFLTGKEIIKDVRLKALEYYRSLVAHRKSKRRFIKNPCEDKLSIEDRCFDESYKVNILEILRNQRNYIRYKNLRNFYLYLLQFVEKEAARYNIFYDKDKLLSRWVTLISLWPSVLEHRKFKEVFEIDKFITDNKDSDNLFEYVHSKFKHLLLQCNVNNLSLLDRFTKFWIDTSKTTFKSMRQLLAYAFPSEFYRIGHVKDKKGSELYFDDEASALWELARKNASIKMRFNNVITNMKLEYMNLQKSKFTGILFAQNASFSNSILSKSEFNDVVCLGTDFRETELEGTKFENAILNGADFSHANFSNTDLKGAVISFAKIDGSENLAEVLNGNPISISIMIRHSYFLNRENRERLKKKFLHWWFRTLASIT